MTNRRRVEISSQTISPTTAEAFRQSVTERRTQEQRILRLLLERGDEGANAWEVHEALPDIMYPSAATALSKLSKKDLIHHSGRVRVATKYDGSVFVAGPRPRGAKLPSRESALKFKLRLAAVTADLVRLKAHVAGSHLERHDCPWCGHEIEVVIQDLKALLGDADGSDGVRGSEAAGTQVAFL